MGDTGRRMPVIDELGGQVGRAARRERGRWFQWTPARQGQPSSRSQGRETVPDVVRRRRQAGSRPPDGACQTVSQLAEPDSPVPLAGSLPRPTSLYVRSGPVLAAVGQFNTTLP